MQTRNCDECEHAALDPTGQFWCAKRHKPRFYPPKDISDAMRGSWGWKRKCEDYKEADNEVFHATRS